MNQDFTEENLAFEADGVLTPAVLARPGHKKARWCIVIIPGSYFSDVDGNYHFEDGNPFEAQPHAYADLSCQMALQGHAVLRYARSGIKISDEDRAKDHRMFGERVAVAREACRTARRLVLEARELAVAGHSEGSAVAFASFHRQS